MLFIDTSMRDLLAIVIVLVAMAPLVYAIDYSMSCDSGSISTSINAGNDDQISSSTVLSQDVLQSSISGSGNFSDVHSVKNSAGREVTVGLNLKNATSYAYSYALNPDEINISASESLDVDRAESIDAYAIAKARASNSENAPSGDTAGSKTHIQNGALIGYSNGASVVNNVLSTHQEFTKASGDQVYVESWGTDQIEYDRKGHMSSSSYSSFQVGTSVANGMIENYNDLSSMSDSVQLDQSGHIIGQFISSVPMKKELGRTSNYGNQFDLRSGFNASLSGSKNSASWDPKVYSQLVYYVDQADPNANRIQGAIDASRNGDGIKILEGQYHENVDIKKSISVQGEGPGKTIISPEGQIPDDSTIKVGKDAFVCMGGISLTNGHAHEGGAIKNEGTLLLNDYEISKNTAKYGSGIYNVGKLILGQGTISNNCASQDGGGVYNKGDLAILGSNISSNEAKYGGGVYNSKGGKAFLEYGNIIKNSAKEYGGGVWNNGLLVMDAGNITSNHATNGGGVYNKNVFCLMNGSISSNMAAVGGGAKNDGSFAMYGGQINSNIANNGGAVFNNGNFAIHNGTISYNEAYSKGGAIYNDGGSITLNGGNISYNRADKDGGIHSVYKLKKNNIKGDKSIVHDNQNGDIGWHHNKGLLISIICGAIAAVIVIAAIAVLTFGIGAYIAAAAAATATAATAASTAATASFAAASAAGATASVSAIISSETAALAVIAASAASAATATATVATAIGGVAAATGIAATAVAALITAIEVVAVTAIVGFSLLTADAIAWLLSMHFAL